MTTKKKAKAPSNQDTQMLEVKNQNDKSKTRKLTEVQLCPTILNTAAVQSFSKHAGDIDFTEAVSVMKEKSEKIIAGDLSELESTLAAQVVSLNAIFITLARRSANSEYLNQMETNLRLALKAQAQSARTVEILASIKNPPIVYAKQANISHGHQQVNNGSNSHAHAEKNINSTNELLSEDKNATLDTRRAIETSKADQKLATVETINGCQDTGR